MTIAYTTYEGGYWTKKRIRKRQAPKFLKSLMDVRNQILGSSRYHNRTKFLGRIIHSVKFSNDLIYDSCFFDVRPKSEWIN